MVTEVGEVVSAVRALRPNQIADLSVARLVHDREWLAVAAYAMASPEQLEGTLAHLATAAADSIAFAWFWGLVSRPDSPAPDAGWSAFASLPPLVGVPSELADAVVAFIAQPGGRSNPRDSAAGFLLARLPAALAKRAARCVLDASREQETLPATQAIDHAIARLSQQRANADRDRVLTSLAERSAGERITLILQMSQPFRSDEADALQRALEETLLQPNPALIAQMQTAWHFVTPEGQRSLLANQIAQSSDRCRAFLTPALLEPLGSDQVLDFLSPSQNASTLAVPPAIATGIVEDLATTGEPFGLELLDLAHGRLDAANLRQIVPRMAQAAQRWEPTRRIAGMTALMRPAVRLADMSIGESALQVILPDDLQDVLSAVRLRKSEDARFLGAWLARYLADGASMVGMTSSQSSAARSDRVAEVLRALPKRWRSPATSAIAESAIPQLPLAIVHVLVTELELCKICARAGRGRDLLEALSREESAVLAPWEERCSVLLSLVEHDPDDAVADEALRVLEADAEAYDEALGPSEFASQTLAALRNRPGPLHRHVLRQLETLDGPQGEAVPPDRLAPVLAEALDTGLVQDVSGTEKHIARLISGHRLLHPLAAKWLAIADPTPTLVEMCVRADEQYARRSPYPDARLAQARTLARRVADIGLETELRVEALVSAAAAHPSVGRTVALATPQDYPILLRRAAAKVLSETPGSAGDIDRLTRLAEEEDDAEALRLLEAALRRLHSGNVGEALNHLLALVDSGLDSTQVSVNVVLPEKSLHDAFIAKVDAARASLSGAPNVAVNSFIDLGEVLVEWALGFAFSANAKTADEGRRLLENAPNKLKVGDLVRRQQLLQDYPWLASYAALREDRSIHVAPAGSTRPVTVVDENVIAARHLTRKVVHGWIDVMYSIRDSGT